VPDPASNLAAKAIDEAFGDQVKELFKGLYSNLVIAPSSHETDQQSLAKFAKGLELANRARQLAHSAVPAEAATARSASKKIKATKLASR
jgi:hypothetical protein